MDRKTVIALAVMLLIILIWPYYVRLISPEAPKIAQIAKPDSTVIDTLKAEAPITPSPQTASPDTTVKPLAALGNGFEPALDYKEITVESPLYKMTFSTRGAVITSCQLLNYKGVGNTLVQLIRPQSPDNLNLLLFSRGHTLDFKDVQFIPSVEKVQLAGAQNASLIFRAQNPQGGWIEKQYTFKGDQYSFDLKVSGGNLEEIDPEYRIEWGSGLAITEVDSSQDIYYSDAFALMGGEIEKYPGGKGDKDLNSNVDGQTEWVAQRNKYFEMAILPQSHPGKGINFGMIAQPLYGKMRPKVFRTSLAMNGRVTEQSGSFVIYLGPLDQRLIKKVHPKLEATMNWGWKIIEPFSKSILWALRGMHNAIPNYGLVLILFSVLIKVIVWPLTQKSTRSMAKMSAVQPKMKELQEKYKGNPEKLNKATLQLYKEEGVNPFSSCWPTLLQMPLLYALFIIFRSTIELRQAPFIFWIKDLSMPDTILKLSFALPLYGNHVTVLPILMGVTQFLMAKQTITDPRQKATMYMMPIFMVLIFNNFPSGLSLYYALFNLWTYLQNDWLKRKGILPSASPIKS